MTFTVLLFALSQALTAPPPTVSPPPAPAPAHPRHKGVITMPRLILLPSVDRFYPPASVNRREEGITRLRCTLTIAGTLDKCVVQTSSGFSALDAAAFHLAAAARYEPMLVDGKAVEEPVILPVRWLLGDDP